MTTINRLRRHQRRHPPYYVLTDRLHPHRSVRVGADDVIGTVSDWLAALGVHSPLVEDFARTLRDGDWAGVHALADLLSVDVTVTT